MNRAVFRFLAFVSVITALVGCAAAPPSQAPFVPPVYPAPPEDPRFEFELTLVSSAQVEEDSREDRMRLLLTGRGGSAVSLAKPHDVVACNGRVFVSDTVHRAVLMFDFVERRFDRIGLEGPGQLVKPMGLATDEQCRLYVADRQLRTVVVFDTDGSYLFGIGGPEYFLQLSYLTVEQDASRVYTVDTGGVSSSDHRVRVFDGTTGEHLYDFGTRGPAEGQFNLPKDIDLMPDGRLAIVDSGNFRVQILEKDGEFVRAFGRVGRQMGQFARPKGIATDEDGNIYVVDTAFGNFQIFNSDGELLMFIGQRADEAGPANANLPAGIDVDASGRVYFVDQFFRKVDVFHRWGSSTRLSDLRRAGGVDN